MSIYFKISLIILISIEIVLFHGVFIFFFESSCGLGEHLKGGGLRSRALPAADTARRSRGSGGDRVRWTKQGAVVGCVAEPLPAAETAEAEQGQPSKYASGPRPAPHIWATATRSSAPIFTRARRRPQGKLAKRKRQTQRPRPADETGSCVWRSAPIFTRARRRPQGKLAKRKRNAVCFLQGRSCGPLQKQGTATRRVQI